MSTPDPSAATDVPRERARLPSEGRDWIRRGRQAEPEELELLPSETPRPVAVTLAAPVPVEVQGMDEDPTDHGETAPLEGAAKPRPYANLDYEERVCCLLEDLIENTRRIDLRLAAEEHRRHVAEAGALDLQGRAPASGLWGTVSGWVRDPKFKDFVVKVFVAGSTAGGSVVGSASTMMLLFELAERLLRAWVELP